MLLRRLIQLICMFVGLFPSSGFAQFNALQWNVTTGALSGNGVAVDGAGNAYICVTTIGFPNDSLEIIKYDHLGNLIWSSSYSVSNADVQGCGVAVDGNGNVFAAGSVSKSQTDSQFALVKFNSSGAKQWAQLFDGSISKEVPIGVHVDATGNAFIAGNSGADESTNIEIVKYDTNGNQIYQLVIDSGGLDRVADFKVDPATGIVYLAGSTDIAVGQNVHAAYAAKVGSSGSLIWGYIYTDDPGEGKSCDFDSSGALVFTGDATNVALGTYLLLIKVSADGSAPWIDSYQGGDQKKDIGNGVVVERSTGTIFATGSTEISASSQDVLAVRYTPDGILENSNHWNGYQLIDSGIGLVEDSYGRIITLSNVQLANHSPEIMINFLDSILTNTGSVELSYNTTVPLGIAESPTGGYATIIGYDTGPFGGNDIRTAQVKQAPIAHDDSYQTAKNTLLSVGAPGVLANDEFWLDSGKALLVTSPAHGNLTLANDGSFTYNPTTNYEGGDSFTYKVQRDGYNSDPATVVLEVGSVAPTSLTISPTVVAGGDPSTGKVTMSGSAPIGGAIVNLSSDAPAVASVPGTVTVPAGLTSVTFPITTYVQNVTQPLVTITATRVGVSKTAVIQVRGSGLSAFTLNPTSVTGGNNSTGTITLTGSAPSAGRTATVSSNSGIIIVPPTVTVTSGHSLATFTVKTAVVAADALRTVTVSLAGVSKSANLMVLAPALYSLTVNPSTVVGGTPTTGTVTLTGPAPSGGKVVGLSSGSSVITVPASVTVLAGKTSANFTIGTKPVVSTVVRTVSATLGAVTKTAAITLIPGPVLTSFTVNPSTVVGGHPTTGTVTLSLAAPAGGAVIALSSASSVIIVPPSVTIPAGSTSANFTITTKAVSSTVVRTATATYSGVSKIVSITLTP